MWKTSRSFIFIHSKCRNQQPRKVAFQSSVKSSRLLDTSGTISQTSSNDEPNDDPNKRPQTSIFQRFPKISKDSQGLLLDEASGWREPRTFRVTSRPGPGLSESEASRALRPCQCRWWKCLPSASPAQSHPMALKNALILWILQELHCQGNDSNCTQEKLQGTGFFFYCLVALTSQSNYDFGPIKTQKYPLACIEAGHDVQTRLYTAASHHSRTHGQSTQIFQDAWQTARTDP